MGRWQGLRSPAEFHNGRRRPSASSRCEARTPPSLLRAQAGLREPNLRLQPRVTLTAWPCLSSSCLQPYASFLPQPVTRRPCPFAFLVSNMTPSYIIPISECGLASLPRSSASATRPTCLRCPVTADPRHRPFLARDERTGATF